MTKLVESDLVDVFEALGDVASRPCTCRLWSWDGNWYPPAGTRAAERPHMVALDEHSHVLVVLIRMAPFGSYTSAQRLMDLLWCMDICYRIFPPCQLAPCLRQRVWSAARQWQLMCKHCVMLFKSKVSWIPETFNGLRGVMAAIGPEDMPMPARISVFDGTTPQCSTCLPDLAPPDNDTPFRTPKRKTTKTKRIANQYRKNPTWREKAALRLQKSKKKCLKGHRELREFQKKVGGCRRKLQPDTWEFRVVKTRVDLKQVGADLRSMQDLIEMHSHCFVLQAIKYGLIPYVPSIRKLGQECEWPESHEFVTDPKYWKVGWRDDPTYNGLVDSADTVREIAEWTCDRDRYRSFAHTRGTYRCLPCSASANKVVMAAIAGTAATAK